MIHGDESEAYDKFDELWECLQRREYAGRLTLEAIPNMNPDGLAIGSRFNADGVDLNRNWPASNFAPHRRRGHAPLSEPETRAVHRVIDERSPDLIVVFHSASSGPFVDPDGPGEAAAEAFVEGARRTDPRWRVHADFTNPAGSLGSYAGLDLGIPTLTIEFRRGQSSDSAHEAAKSGLRVLFENLVNSNR
ncbi:MAG: M14 family zinc carboxypeptidase [Planctomycetota bacterium]